MVRGSPDYFFETSSSFLPEQYTIEGLFSDTVCVFAMLQSDEFHRTQKYFLTYAETPRRWRRITMALDWDSNREQPDFSRAIVLDNYEMVRKTLPAQLLEPVTKLLQKLELFSSVTRLSLSLGEDDTGQVIINAPSIEIVEDLLEIGLCSEDQVLDDIDDLDCAFFFEIRGHFTIMRLLHTLHGPGCVSNLH